MPQLCKATKRDKHAGATRMFMAVCLGAATWTVSPVVASTVVHVKRASPHVASSSTICALAAGGAALALLSMVGMLAVLFLGRSKPR